MSCANYTFSNNDYCCCWLENDSFKWGCGFDYTAIVRRYFAAHPLWDKFKARGTHGMASTSNRLLPVPNARAQPYHPCSGSHGQHFALTGAHQYGIAVIVLSLSRIKISKIQVNQQWRQSACSLRGRRLKGNGKEIPGAREARKACKGKEKESSPPPLSLARGLATKFPSFSNACHAGQRELRKEFYKNHNES